MTDGLEECWWNRSGIVVEEEAYKLSLQPLEDRCRVHRLRVGMLLPRIDP